MIDLSRPLPLPDLRVRAWADTDDDAVVWACAAGPRWVIGADGDPEVSLLLYRRGASGPVEGGQATAGVDLALTSAERDAVVEATASSTCRALEWRTGEIELRLLPGLSTTSEAALLADNRCTAMFTLDAAAAERLRVAWQDGLPQAHAVARGTIVTRSHAAAERSRSAATATAVSDLRVVASVSHAVEAPLTLAADLRLAPADRKRRLTDVHL